MNQARYRQIKPVPYTRGSIVYWMSRDQRIQDNFALSFAQALADRYKNPLFVVFNLIPEFLQATWRQYGFMLEGLKQIERDLAELNIPFYLLLGTPGETLPTFIRQRDIGMLISDFSPLKIAQQWKQAVTNAINIPFYEVDAHNTIPCWQASAKQEFSARTLRSKIIKLQSEFNDLPSPIHPHIYNTSPLSKIDWNHAIKSLKIDHSIPMVDWCQSGELHAQKTLHTFINDKLSTYADNRNNPTKSAQSELSPYLHFGQISVSKIAALIQASASSDNEKATFLEELIVRQELAENFCFYNQNYDQFWGFPAWARKTLDEHRSDKRSYLYHRDVFEQSKTHDRLWNAAQTQMVQSGKMHGFMRMYWAKKILEWTESPEEAIAIAIYLNDKYELDGRDPNGYTGIAWAIGGVHDRPWFERPIFGQIRYMNDRGCARKFDTESYIKAWSI